MSSHLGDILLALALLIVASAAGAGLLKLVRFPIVGSFERWLISLSLGFAFVSYLLFALGSLGWLNLTMGLFVVGCAIVLGAPLWAGLVSGLRSTVSTYRFSGFGHLRRPRPAVLLYALIGVTAALNLIGALAPPTEWDSLDYHLGAVKYFVDHGEVSFVPYRNWASPMTAQMWNMLGLLFGSERLPQLFQWAIGLGSAGALYLLAARRTSHVAGVLAAAIYYTSPLVFNLATSARSDLAWLMFTFLSLHTLLVWKETRGDRWLILSAIFTGLALGTRFQALFWAPAMLLALIILQRAAWRSAPIRTIVWTSSYGVIAALVASPWFLRNWFTGGDPIWPYGYPIFHSRFWTEALHDKYAAWSAGPGDSGWHYLTGLWNLTVNQSAWEFGLRLPVTPVLLAFLPALFLVGRRMPSRTLQLFALILVVVVVYYTFWFTTYQQTRYLVPVLALLMIPAAYAFWQMTGNRWTRWVATGVLTSTFVLFIGYNVIFNAQFVPVVFGSESRDDFLADKVSFYDDIRWVNRNLPDDSLLLFYHQKSYYLEQDFLRSDANLWEVDGVSTPDDLLDLLQERGITHVFVPDWDEVIFKGLLDQLVSVGDLEVIYTNPAGVQIVSRTLSQSRLREVKVLEISTPLETRRRPTAR